MANMQRVTRITGGGVVRVTEGIMQGSGPRGATGPTGPPGSSTRVVGMLADEVAIKAQGDQGNVSNGRDGWTWIAEDTGVGWSWNAVTSQWVNIGRIVGPPGYINSVMGQVTADGGTGQSIPGNTPESGCDPRPDAGSSVRGSRPRPPGGG